MNDRGFDDLQRGVLPREEIFQRLTQNPWDRKVTAGLLMRIHGDEQRLLYHPEHHGPEENLLPVQITADAYDKIVPAMLQARSLEDKYRLLAQEAPIHPKYSSWYKEYPRLYWYDVVQGFPHTVSAARVSDDPLEGNPDNVYVALEKVLAREEFAGTTLGIDLGSGPGEVSRFIAAACKKVTAYDLFPFMHDIARERNEAKGIHNIVLEVADISKGIPAPDHSAGIIVSNGLTAFIPHDGMEYFVNELKRVLIPGGSYLESSVEGKTSEAIVHAYLTNGKTLLAYLLGELMTSPGPGKSGRYPHSSKWVDGLFRKHGFGLAEYSENHRGYFLGVSVLKRSAPNNP